MPISFTFDAALNPDKCFLNTPPLSLEVNNLPKLPKDWLTELENKCRRVKTDLEKNIFFKHVGQKSKYRSKNILLEQLSLIYCRISGNLDKHLGSLDSESSKLLLLELIEDIQQCTPGFHIRVNKLINSLHTPDHFDQLLYLVRKSIIEKIAANLTNQVKAIYQVHVANRVCQIAKKEGLAIEPNVQKDQYKSFLSGNTIRKHLKTEFSKHYTCFKIPYLLAEQLQLILSRHRYTGPKETGYAIGPAEEILRIIRVFLVNSVKASDNKLYPFFILDEFDEFDEPIRIYDLDWPLIRQFFFQKLVYDNYFTEKPVATNLLEYTYFQALMPEKASLSLENQFINQYLNEQNYADLIDDLNLIHDRFPDYWKKLIKNSLIIDNIVNFFKFLVNQSYNTSNAEELLKKFNHVYTLLFAQTQEFILRIIGTKINSVEFKYNFFFKSVKYRPEIAKYFLNELFATKRQAHQLFLELLSRQDSVGFNLLMLGGKYHVETTQLILDLISENIEGIEKEKILSLISPKNRDNWNLLSLAAKYQPDAIKFILDFIKQYPQIFDLNKISELFYQKNKQHWNFLELLVHYHSKFYLNVCLEFLQEKFESSDNEQWLELFFNNHTGIFLCSAAQSNFSTLKSILIFIDRHINQLNNQNLQNFFLKIYANDWHCLHLASRYNSSNLLLILDFIEKYISRFDVNSLSSLFLAQNNNENNFIQLAARHQPDSIDRIFKFISQNIEFFDKTTLKQLFLQQNSSGWNFLSNACLHPGNIKIILDFISQHNNQFDPETILQVILQNNKYAYNCLHLCVQFQSDSLEIILNFIKPRIGLFAQPLNQLFQIKKSPLHHMIRLFQSSHKQKNLLALSLKYQSESALLFLKFLNTYALSFNLESQIIKKFISQASKLEKNESSTECIGLFNPTLNQHPVFEKLALSDNHALTDDNPKGQIRLGR